MKAFGFPNFGHYGHGRGPGDPDAGQVLKEAVEIAIGADEIGVNGAYWRVHHYARQAAAPIPLLSAAGARTRRIEVGTGVIDMRYENPLYLAEEVAALDLLTDQHIAIGISRGSPEQVRRGRETFGYTGGVDPRGADVAHARIARLLDAIRGVPQADLDTSGGMAPGASSRLRIEPHAPGVDRHLWWGAGLQETAEWTTRRGLNLTSSTLLTKTTGEGFFHLQVEQIRRYRRAWKEADHNWTPCVSVSRSIFPIVSEVDWKLFALRGEDSHDQIGAIDSLQSTFGCTYAAEPNALIEQLARDEALHAADTFMLATPSQLGVDFNLHILRAFAEHVAPALGWQPNTAGPVTGYSLEVQTSGSGHCPVWSRCGSVMEDAGDQAPVVTWMEYHQMVLYLGALVAGAVLEVGDSHSQQPSGGGCVSLVLITPLYTIFLDVSFRRLRAVFGDARFMATLMAINLLAVPAVVLPLPRLVADESGLLVGTLLVPLAPCVGYVMVSTWLASGAWSRILAASPVFMLLQALALPLWLALVAGSPGAQGGGISWRPFAQVFVLMIMLPMGLSILTRCAAPRVRSADRPASAATALMVPLMMATLLPVIASQVPHVASRPDVVARMVPLFVAFALVMPAMGDVAGRMAHQGRQERLALAFSGTTRNSLVVLPLALVLPDSMGMMPIVVVAQASVELVVMAIGVHLLPRFIRQGAMGKKPVQ